MIRRHPEIALIAAINSALPFLREFRRDDQLRTAFDKLRKHEDAPVPTETAPRVKVEGLLAPPSDFAEVFQGEIMEHLLAAVKESLVW